jgi:hypothetical protein
MKDRPIPCRALVLLVAFACSNLAFGGNIHDAAWRGDLDEAKTLLKGSPDLVFSTDKGPKGHPLN